MGPAAHNDCPICLNAMNGWFIDTEISLEAELGVKTPELKKMGITGKTHAKRGINIQGLGAETETEFKGKYGFKGSDKSEVKLGPGGVGSKRSGNVDLEYNILNFMQYKSATVYWEIPKKADTLQVTPCKGSGYAYGQSVVVDNLFKYGREALSRKKSGNTKRMAFIERLSISLRVSYDNFLAFLKENWWLIEANPYEAS